MVTMVYYAAKVQADRCVTPVFMTSYTVLGVGRHLNGIHKVREPTGLEGQLNLGPDGVTLLPWNRGKPMMWDYTCPDTLAPSHISISRATAGAAVAEVEERTRPRSILNSHSGTM